MCRIFGHAYDLTWVEPITETPNVYVISCHRCGDLLATGEAGPYDSEDYR